MRYLLFWDVAQRWLLVSCRRFVPILALKMGRICCPETLVTTTHRYVIPQKGEDLKILFAALVFSVITRRKFEWVMNWEMTGWMNESFSQWLIEWMNQWMIDCTDFYSNELMSIYPDDWLQTDWVNVSMADWLCDWMVESVTLSLTELLSA